MGCTAVSGASFEFATVPRIIVGPGTSAEVPAMTAGLGTRVLACTGGRPERHQVFLDALATPLTDGLALQGLRRAASGLRRAYADGGDRAARADMAVCSLVSGMALANAKLGAVHGFAGVLGGTTPGWGTASTGSGRRSAIWSFLAWPGWGSTPADRGNRRPNTRTSY